MSMPGPDVPVRRRAGLSATPVETDVFLVVPETEEIFHLNSLGRALWELLAEPMTAGELAAAVAEAFPDEPRERIAADVAAFLKALLARGLAGPAD
ncbi:MAG: hypothetical protein RL477_1181 [Pseudomonadota bacterium]|jgi:hypothetical protein